MQRSGFVGLLTNWPWRSSQGPVQELPRRRAASRVESYVYGNVLVLAAIVTAGTGDVADGRAAALALGTAASTFIAHVLAMMVGHSTEEETETGGREFVEALRDGVPMASSGIIPSIALTAGWLGWLHPDVAWWIAIGVIGVRFVALGSVVSYLKGTPNTWRNLLIGIGLAVVGLLVALLKNQLTH